MLEVLVVKIERLVHRGQFRRLGTGKQKVGSKERLRGSDDYRGNSTSAVQSSSTAPS
jgi:hypothetical protein